MSTAGTGICLALFWLAAMASACGAARDEGPEAFALAGTVLSGEGAPVEGGSINFGNREGFGPIRNGRFEFRVTKARPGTHLVSYHRDDGSVVTGQLVDIEPGQESVVVSLRRGGEPVIRGRIISDALPEGVPRAMVHLRGHLSGAGDSYAYIRASKDGTFSLDGLAFEGYALQASFAHYLESEPVKISPPYPMAVVIHLKSEAVISGTAVTEAGSPVARAQVFLAYEGGGRLIEADDEGHFEFDHLQAGSYHLEAQGHYVLGGDVVVDTDEGERISDVTIELSEAGGFPAWGRVMRPDGKSGISKATISFEMTFTPPGAPGHGRPLAGGGGAVARVAYSTVSGSEGAYALMLPRRLGPAAQGHPWTVLVEAQGYLPRRYLGFVDPDEWHPLVFQLFRGGRLTGSVVCEDGGPPPADAVVEVGVAAGLFAPEGRFMGSSWTGSPVSPIAGEFDFPRVQPGEHEIIVRIPGQTILSQTVTVREGKTSHVVLRVPEVRGQ
jgi:hypothetical protein